MKTHALGRGAPQVTEFCLGTMTFGTQTDTADAHRQISMALEAGINFIDTAEAYPVNPISAETAGDTEAIIGEWNAANPGRRGEYVLATKVAGEGLGAIRDGAPISRATILEAVEASLRRLQTDHIDLYQLHWPNRGSYHFRQNWSFDPSGQSRADTMAHMEEVLVTIDELVTAGKIGHFGLSNESAWGTAQWLRMAEDKGLPRVVSIQNEYSLLARLFDTDLAELCVNEEVGLMAFSPLAAGLLTGKYQGGAVPDGSRMAINGNLGGRVSPRVWDAVDAYAGIAQAHGLDLTQMSLAWCKTRPFMGSILFGASSVTQLEHILNGLDLTLSDEVVAEIDAAHKAHPMPY
ncbi:aldo/keto reductase [Dinoroseobacter sp. S124A]|uniref:aldo/keto reductase n=1 Tax=Dinoroseobacter sp. S124A TaxID=3415128 RepID=UPI003C7C77C0